MTATYATLLDASVRSYNGRQLAVYMMFVRLTVLVIASVIAVQLQIAFARSVDVSHVTRSPASDVITAPARGRPGTLFQQHEQSDAGSTTVSGRVQIQRKSSTPLTSTTAASPYARHDRPSFISERPKVSVDRSLFSSITNQTAGSRMHSDVNMSPTAAKFHMSDAPTAGSSLQDDEVLNTKSTSALTSMSCLWTYSSNKALRKRLCNCNVGPLQVLAKTSTELQFYFCDNEQDLLATLACYFGNNGTLSAGSRGQSNCLNGQCNVGPLWIQKSDESSQQAAYYCSNNLGLQLGQVHRRQAQRITSSQLSLMTERSTQPHTANHRGLQQRITPRPTSITNDKNDDLHYSKRPTIINSINHWSSDESVTSDISKRRPKFGSHARVPGTVPNNSTHQKRTKT